jgi:ribosomal protein S18 acetylase RimI-like enzyme
MMVRPATAADLPAIEAIEDAVFEGDRLSRRSLRYFLAAPGALILVLAFSDHVVGYSLIAMRKKSVRARLYSIALNPGEHGRGLGRFLLHASEQAAKAHGARFMRLEVRTDNAAAIALYQKNGYRAFGRIDDYYEDGGEALRFEKALSPDDSKKAI